MKETKTGRQQAPARTVEGREQQMMALAMDLAEKKLRDGTASNMLICHFLKLATVQAELDKEKTRADVDWRKAQIESIKEQKSLEETYTKAIEALKTYQGLKGEDDSYD